MNIEIDQQQKFIEQFMKLTEDASLKFKSKWDYNIQFINPTRKKIIPSFGIGVIDALSVELRAKFETLRNRYYAKSL
jgi:hypothetical protein